MDDSWKGKAVRTYWLDGVDTDAMRSAAELDITPEATITTDKYHAHVVQEFLAGYERYLEIPDEEREELQTTFAKHGLIATDLHKYNIMRHPDTGDVKVVDYEQFHYL